MLCGQRRGALIMRLYPALSLTAIAVAAGIIAATVPASAKPAQPAKPATADTGICTSAKHPELAARISKGVLAALAPRTDSSVGVAVADPREDLTCTYHATWHFISASVIKATIISALLLKEGGPAGMTKSQHALAWGMITQSNNDDAQALWTEVGMSAMQKFLNKAGMTHTKLNEAWGLSLLTPNDELRLLHVLTYPGSVLSTKSRDYALWLMSKVIPSERWGVPAGAPSDVTVHVKNGWLNYPTNADWHVNSIGTFTGHNISYQIVVLTEPHDEQSESYGIGTIQAAAKVINHDLAKV
jgi:beta-lactamase class A